MGNNSSKTLKQVIAERSNDYTFLENKYLRETGNSLSLDPFTPPLNNTPSKSLPLTVSVVIPAYNVETSILACLTSIEHSNFNLNHQSRLQVIVVDDGSDDNTWSIIKKSKFSMHLTVIRQNNHGQAQALNTGISVAEGDIIVSCDADMVLSYYTIDHFMARHQQLQNVLLTGFRSEVSKADPRVNPDLIRKYGIHQNSYFARDERIVFPTPGWPSNMCLTSDHYRQLGYGRGLWMPDDEICEDPWLLSDLVIGALFSLPREVFLNIGGYDERFHGWGCADSLLAAKAIASKQYIIPVYAASGLHVSHPFRTKNKYLEYTRNRKKFFEIIKTEGVNSSSNWIKHAKDRIIESFIRNPMQGSFRPKNIKSNYEKIEFPWNEIDSLLAIGEYSRAFNALTRNTKIEKNGEYLIRLGKILFEKNKYQEAIDIFHQASNFIDIKVDSMLNLAIAQVANNQFVLAHSILEKLSQTYPKIPSFEYWYNYSAQNHIQQGRNYFNQQFHESALRCFEAALLVEPKNKTALAYRDRCMSLM